MKTILIVDDSKTIRGVVKAAVEGEARCLEAEDLTKASFLFVKHEEIDAILVDGSVTANASSPNNDFTPEEWVRRLRGKSVNFKGTIIAFSASRSSRRRLMGAGCDAQFAKGDDSLADLLRLIDL